MTALGFALLFAGALLVVAEAHVPGGILGVLGGIALIGGGIIAIAALGGGATLAVPVGVGLGAGSATWVLVAARKAAASRPARIRAGTEALCGRIGVVRRWSRANGQVFVDGALWRARDDDLADAGAEELHEGDAVVVERVNGLTLSVRRAEQWELIA
jgi:membrane-bound ClpP family serine protease